MFLLSQRISVGDERKKSKFPKGWEEERVRRVPAVRELIAKHQAFRHSKTKTTADNKGYAPRSTTHNEAARTKSIIDQTDYNPHLNAALLEAVDTQLRENNPPATRDTLDRLKRSGHSDSDARRLIGAVLAAEIYEILKRGKSFDLKRYIDNLNRLPAMPWEP